jgi:hypothetical protein
MNTKIKVREASGRALDFLVAKHQARSLGVNLEEPRPLEIFIAQWAAGANYRYSTNDALGGPICDHFKIATLPPHGDVQLWEAYQAHAPKDEFYGPTRLVAAMRCYAACVLGEEVEIPYSILEMKEYAFDCTLKAAIRIKAASRAEAEATIRDVLDGASCNGGAWPNGDPILFEASLDGGLSLYEVDGKEVGQSD